MPIRRFLDQTAQSLFGYSAERRSPAAWEQTYREGYWRRLEDVNEVTHYAAIVGYVGHIAPTSILDVGCGHGVLCDRLRHLGYTRYLGTDISATAIAEARARHADPRHAFEVANAETDRPAGRFDLLIFNECLYYLGDPRAVLEAHLAHLEPTGHVIVSMFVTPRSRAIWPLLAPCFATIDAATVTHQSGAAWRVALGTAQR